LRSPATCRHTGLMLEGRRAPTWLWRVGLAGALLAPAMVAVIGYLRRPSPPDVPALRDGLELLVALDLAVLSTLPLLMAACFFARDTSVTPNRGPVERAAPQRWAALLALTLAGCIGFVVFFWYLFGPLGVAIRSWVSAIYDSLGCR
jgi:hypothetical protein